MPIFLQALKVSPVSRDIHDRKVRWSNKTLCDTANLFKEVSQTPSCLAASLRGCEKCSLRISSVRMTGVSWRVTPFASFDLGTMWVCFCMPLASTRECGNLSHAENVQSIKKVIQTYISDIWTWLVLFVFLIPRHFGSVSCCKIPNCLLSSQARLMFLAIYVSSYSCTYPACLLMRTNVKKRSKKDWNVLYTL